jgi:hypothetical protein
LTVKKLGRSVGRAVDNFDNTIFQWEESYGAGRKFRTGKIKSRRLRRMMNLCGGHEPQKTSDLKLTQEEISKHVSQIKDLESKLSSLVPDAKQLEQRIK